MVFADVCFEEGLEYQSEPVAVVPNVDSPASCLDECKNNNDCLFFSYDNDTKDCTLTNSNDSKVPVSSASSGSVLCWCLNYVGLDIFGLLNIDAYPNKIVSYKLNSLQQLWYNVMNEGSTLLTRVWCPGHQQNVLRQINPSSSMCGAKHKNMIFASSGD